MNEGLIPNRYAKALYDYAIEQKAAGSVYDEANRLASVYEAESGLAKAVCNPFLSVDDKCKLLLTASASESGGCLDKFFRLVLDHGREAFMREIVLAYGRKYRAANGILQVVITTAAVLSDAAMEKIKASVQACFVGKKLEYRTVVDADLIGGFTVKVDSQLLDASMSNELRKLRLKLLSKK